MLERTKGVVLHQLRYNDESLIVDIYTLSRGRMSFLVRSSRKRKGSRQSLLLRPLNIVEIGFDFRPTQSLQRLSDIQISESYSSLLYDPLKEIMALYLSDFLYHALKNEGENPSLFRYLTTGMLYFDNAEKGVSNFHITFLIHLTKHLGYWPDLNEGVGIHLEPEEGAYLPTLLRINFSNMHLFRMERRQRSRILELIELYYRIHVPEFPEMKSLDVMRELF